MRGSHTGNNYTHNATPIAKVNMIRIIVLVLLIMFISIKGVTLFIIIEINHPHDTQFMLSL